MQRHVYYLTYNEEQCVRIETLDIQKFTDQYIFLKEPSKIFLSTKLPYHSQ